MQYFKMLIILCICFFSGEPVKGEPSIFLYYFERSPYSVTDSDGGVRGLVATPAVNAFERAGIPFQWKKMPFKRQLVVIKLDKKRACGIGWLKNPERASFARFTDVVYQDRPTVIVSKNGNKALELHRDLKSLIKDKEIRLLVKNGFSYGAYIDALINRLNPPIVSVVTSNNLQMLQMIRSDRADYLFMSEEEAKHIILSAGYELSQFRLLHFDDMPESNRRYIACSRQVSPKILHRLNRALKDRDLDASRNGFERN